MAQDTRLVIRKPGDGNFTAAEAANTATMRVIDLVTGPPRVRGFIMAVHLPTTGVDATKTATFTLADAANASGLLVAPAPGAFADTTFSVSDTMKAADRLLVVRFTGVRRFISCRGAVTAGGNFGAVGITLRNEVQSYG